MSQGSPGGDPAWRSWPVGGSAGLSFESQALAAEYNAGYRDAPGARTVITFRVETRQAVDETYARLARQGARGLQEPHDAFWGARYAIVEDPDGRQVGLMNPSDPARRTPPPAL